MIAPGTYRGEFEDGLPRVTFTTDGDEPFAEILTPYRAWSLMRSRRQASANEVRPACTGFHWGYRGSGPHCLALTIVLHCLRDDVAALRLYEEFARSYCYGWAPFRPWSISAAEIAEWSRPLSIKLHPLENS